MNSAWYIFLVTIQTEVITLKKKFNGLYVQFRLGMYFAHLMQVFFFLIKHNVFFFPLPPYDFFLVRGRFFGDFQILAAISFFIYDPLLVNCVVMTRSTKGPASRIVFRLSGNVRDVELHSFCNMNQVSCWHDLLNDMRRWIFFLSMFRSSLSLMFSLGL